MARKHLQKGTKGHKMDGKIPVGTSDGIHTFWTDEGWPENLRAVAKPVEPIVPKYEYEAPAKHATENGHEVGPKEESNNGQSED